MITQRYLDQLPKVEGRMEVEVLKFWRRTPVVRNGKRMRGPSVEIRVRVTNPDGLVTDRTVFGKMSVGEKVVVTGFLIDVKARP